MRVLVQRSGKASVTVEGKVVGSIDSGLMLLVGFTQGDDLEKVKHLAKKVVNLRIFPDENDVMNKSIVDFGGDILSVSQFTLYGDAKKGNRPSYIEALKNDEAIPLYEAFNEELRSLGMKVETGVFGADMDVALVNVGPTTILLEK
jgi:D-tyrosyl-tRNA(Tyr) deacylase